MIKRLKIKFVCINMLIVTVMLAAIFGMVLHSTRNNLEKRSIQMIQGIHDSRPAMGPINDDRIPHFIVTVGPRNLMTVSSDLFFRQESEEVMLEIARTVYESDEMSGVLQDYGLRFSRRITPYGEQLIFVDISTEQNIWRDLLQTCAVIAVISYVLFFIISVVLARWAIRPVETAWDQQRQFVADASHELKTPLTVIMTNAELLQEPAYPAQEKAKFAGSILAMSHQMRGLVDGLLNLARIDNGAVKTVFTELNLSALVEDCLLPFEPLFFEKGMLLQSSIEKGICVRGSEAHLRQVVEILLDNASKYAESESMVQLQLKRQGIHTLLSVSNPGEDISREDLKNIFKRFYRIDKSRSMNHSYGLGLSIAESIVKEHGGKIWAESQGGMISFHVQLLQHYIEE